MAGQLYSEMRPPSESEGEGNRIKLGPSKPIKNAKQAFETPGIEGSGTPGGSLLRGPQPTAPTQRATSVPLSSRRARGRGDRKRMASNGFSPIRRARRNGGGGVAVMVPVRH
jgi:hypothetical protein